MKKVLYLLLLVTAALLLYVGFSPGSSRAADGSKITIAYSSNVLGYLEPCG